MNLAVAVDLALAPAINGSLSIIFDLQEWIIFLSAFHKMNECLELQMSNCIERLPADLRVSNRYTAHTRIQCIKLRLRLFSSEIPSR